MEFNIKNQMEDVIRWNNEVGEDEFEVKLREMSAINAKDACSGLYDHYKVTTEMPKLKNDVIKSIIYVMKNKYDSNATATQI